MKVVSTYLKPSLSAVSNTLSMFYMELRGRKVNGALKYLLLVLINRGILLICYISLRYVAVLNHILAYNFCLAKIKLIIGKLIFSEDAPTTWTHLPIVIQFSEKL